MSKKTFIFLATIILIILIVFLYFYNKDKVNIESLDYYKYLAKECEQKENYDCCISSVKIMAEGNHKLVPEAGCPEGYQINTLKCIDSFQWCEKEIVEKIINETVGWETYENIEYGFELKYPSFFEKSIDSLFSEKQLATLFHETENRYWGYIAIGFQKLSDSDEKIKTLEGNTYLPFFDEKTEPYGSLIKRRVINGMNVYINNFGAYGISGREVAVALNEKEYILLQFTNEANEDYFFELVLDSIKEIFKFDQKTYYYHRDTHIDKELGIYFYYPNSWGDIIVNKEKDFDYVLSFSLAPINIRKATQEDKKNDYMNFSRVKEINNLKFYFNDFVGRHFYLSRVYSFKNNKDEIILIWLGTNRLSSFPPDEIKNQKTIEKLRLYEELNSFFSSLYLIDDNLLNFNFKIGDIFDFSPIIINLKDIDLDRKSFIGIAKKESDDFFDFQRVEFITTNNTRAYYAPAGVEDRLLEETMEYYIISVSDYLESLIIQEEQKEEYYRFIPGPPSSIRIIGEVSEIYEEKIVVNIKDLIIYTQ